MYIQEAVASAADTLTGIARDLAKDEYEDYTDIQSEITQACDGKYYFACLYISVI